MTYFWAKSSPHFRPIIKYICSIIYRTSCDLRELQPEKSHYLELDLVDQPGVISLYVALTAQNAIGCVSDLTRHEDDEEYLSDIKNEFSLFQTFGSLKKIGWLQVCILYLRTKKKYWKTFRGFFFFLYISLSLFFFSGRKISTSQCKYS